VVLITWEVFGDDFNAADEEMAAVTRVYYPLVYVEEVLPILNDIAIFGGFNDRQLYEIFKLLKTTCYEAGEFIYRRGDGPSHIYIVKNGEVKVIIDQENISLELASLTVGECFGETSVIGIQPHFSSAVADRTTELIVLERKVLLNIFERDKELFGLLILNIARETSRRLRKSEEELANYVFRELSTS